MTGEPDSAPDRVAGVVDAVRSSRKYATVAEGVVRRMAAKALQRERSARAAQRAVRGKLHQVYAAYLAPGDLGRAERLLAALPERPAPEELAQAARRILARHASSAERLAFQEGLLARLLSAGGFTGPLRRVVDLGCGFHPLTLPWMGLPPETEYRAFDIDTRLAALVALFLRRSGRAGLAATWDLLSPPPEAARGADLALLWKTLPLLEQQERGAGLRLLRALPARWWVVSFPARSLGGREKGMREHYDRLARDLARLLHRPLRRIDLPNETFYILAPAE